MSTRSKVPKPINLFNPTRATPPDNFVPSRASVSAWPSRVSRHGRQQTMPPGSACRCYFISSLLLGSDEGSFRPASLLH